MNRFDLNNHFADVYSSGTFGVDNNRPVIGVTGNYGEQTCKLGEGYYKQIVKAGGTPLIIPPTADKDMLLSVLNRVDGILLSGGADINPLYCGEEPAKKLSGINAERDLPELLLARLAYNRQMPILGICRGIQTMAVALGGKVAQDISDMCSIKHSQDADRSEPTHSVTVETGSVLYNIYNGEETLYVNSFHHQAVSDAGNHFKVVARSKDNIIEAIESCEEKPFLGVQWHPECLGEEGLPLFEWLVNEAKTYSRVSSIHRKIITLDSHCDTPMFFPQNVNFATRDNRILVDLPKMIEGGLDATIMVCYLPQPKPGEDFQKNIAFNVEGPRAYADLIFDKIGQIVDANSTRLAFARTPAELLVNKQNGKKSIMLGIENGLALEDSIDNVARFKARGVVYITLCHNGDNAICDSARSTQTHGGVSEFGARVIKEMNRQGVIVDLSHAAESSFYDALQISEMPIVCSHSSARALCDHPRNLTDEQMRALAEKDGVCQVTLYHGFLKKDSSPTEVTILDAMQHLDHAIEVMGIDHVGLGTDFDGDGGVRGLADASELKLFTRQLLARRYSEADIQKIWGGNFLRVMEIVQKNR